MLTFHEINNLFWNFVKDYDMKETDILQKVVHTFAVANICFDASSRFNMNKDEQILCYMIGMFHDLGRFEQWQRYSSFEDSKTPINHGLLGKEIFLNRFTPKSLDITEEQYNLIANTIHYHLVRYEGSDPTLWKYLEIIHSSDAYDNVRNTALGVHLHNTYNDGYSQELLDKFLSGEKIYMYPALTKVDRLLKSIGNAYCVTIDFMRQEIINKNYFETIFNSYKQYLTKEDQDTLRFATDHIKKNYKA